MAKVPKWITPDRQTCLVRLCQSSGGFCVYGHKLCQIPEHHYEVYAELLIKDWVNDDRAQALADWQAEQKALHTTSDRRFPLEGRFSGVGKDIFYAHQPQSYIIALGMSGLTFKPFAKVRIASSYVSLHVDIDLSQVLKGVGKNERRKAIRYGRLTDTIKARIREAVRHYLDHRVR